MIKVGEYVRTKEGIIGKITHIEDKGTGTRLYGESLEDRIITIKTNIENFDEYLRAEDYNVKHSKNIIDLIEVGDYVNGDFVLQKENGKIIAETGSDEYGEYEIENKDIKSIVTKEMMKSVEYRVE